MFITIAALEQRLRKLMQDPDDCVVFKNESGVRVQLRGMNEESILQAWSTQAACQLRWDDEAGIPIPTERFRSCVPSMLSSDAPTFR